MFKNKLKIYPLQIKKKYQDVAMLPWLNLKYEKKGKFHFQIWFCSCSSSIPIYIVFEDVLYLRSRYHWPSRTLEYFLQCSESGHNLLTVLFLVLMSRKISFWSIFPRPFFARDVDILNSLPIFCHLSHLCTAEERRWEGKPNIRGEKD